MQSEAITFKILSSNTLNPEIIEINPPTNNTITVLADSFFTNLVCQKSVDELFQSEDKIPDISQLDTYIRSKSWWKRCEYKYMKTKAKTLIWVEKELFRKIATFNDTKE